MTDPFVRLGMTPDEAATLHRLADATAPTREYRGARRRERGAQMTRRATMRRGPEPEEWYVTRHGGRSRDNWRVVYISTDRDKAVAAYEAEVEALRQGGVQLWKPGGGYHVMVGEQWSPRLRTRW